MPIGGGMQNPPNIDNGFMSPGNAFAPTVAGMGLDRKKICLLHKQPLRYFCDSCEELICYDCTVMGPHNT
jgi:hypothetical protein